MRVWLVDEKNGAGSLEPLLRQLQDRAETGLSVAGVSVFLPDFADAMGKLVPDLLDVLVINQRAWPDHAWTENLLSLGLGILVVAPPERALGLRTMAQTHPILFIPPAPDVDALWLGLLATLAAKERDMHWKNEVATLQQRLTDRIIIEKAKGILVQRLKISEQDAYRRLRMLSRRQRRQIRDIAQSLIDTEYLFAAEDDGFARLLPDAREFDEAEEADGEAS